MLVISALRAKALVGYIFSIFSVKLVHSFEND